MFSIWQILRLLNRETNISKIEYRKLERAFEKKIVSVHEIKFDIIEERNPFHGGSQNTICGLKDIVHVKDIEISLIQLFINSGLFITSENINKRKTLREDVNLCIPLKIYLNLFDLQDPYLKLCHNVFEFNYRIKRLLSEELSLGFSLSILQEMKKAFLFIPFGDIERKFPLKGNKKIADLLCISKGKDTYATEVKGTIASIGKLKSMIKKGIEQVIANDVYLPFIVDYGFCLVGLSLGFKKRKDLPGGILGIVEPRMKLNVPFIDNTIIKKFYSYLMYFIDLPYHSIVLRSKNKKLSSSVLKSDNIISKKIYGYDILCSERFKNSKIIIGIHADIYNFIFKKHNLLFFDEVINENVVHTNNYIFFNNGLFVGLI